MARVMLKEVSKVYPGGITAISACGLEIGDGELFVLVGPSGSGKSTLLRLIAGLETPTAGEVWIGRRRVDRLAPAERDVAMVFQTPALYPHLSIRNNLAFGLRARRTPKLETTQRVNTIAERLGLTELLDRAPATLSGGQRQRVALGRAIVREPQVFLLDEPFSSLDAPLRAALQAEIVELHRKLGTTMIHVTHDQAEAMALGNRIAVMEQGRVVQIGTPRQVYQHPAHRFVAGFIGNPPMNVLPCQIERSGDALTFRIAGAPDASAWTTTLAPPWTALFRDVGPRRIDLGLRPESISLADGPSPHAGLWRAPALIRRLEPLGHETIATLAVGPHQLHLRLPPETACQTGDRVAVGLDPSQAAWFDAETGRALGDDRSPSEDLTA